MPKRIIRDPQQVQDINRLRREIIDQVGTRARRACRPSRETLERIRKGPLKGEALTPNAIVRFIAGESNFIHILFDENYDNWVKLLIRDNRVEVFTRDRFVGSDVAITHPEPALSAV